jgi:multicomponent K+:H+ antiporter subunit G
MTNLWAEIAISAFLVIGGVFGLVGSYGLVKLQGSMRQLHAPTKATTLGVGGVLIASMLFFLFVDGDASLHELLITIFLLLTAPVTAQFIAKTHIHRRERPDTLPPTGTGRPWASFESDEDRARIEAERKGARDGAS